MKIHSEQKKYKLLHVKKTFTVVSILFLSLTAKANSLCENVFQLTEKLEVLSEEFLTVKKREFEASHSNASVRAEERINTEHGHLLIFEKTGNSWFSTYTPRPDNYQGDPRWFPSLVSTKVSSKFGFFMLNQKMMTAPTAEKINQTIHIFNKHLPEKNKILIKFYETGETPQSGLNYLKLFNNNLSLPMASRGHYAVHDISYHLPAIFLPKNVINAAQLRLDLIIRFRDWVENYGSERKWLNTALLKIAKSLVAEKVRHVDYATGNLGYVLYTSARNFNDVESYDIKRYVLNYLYRANVSPKNDVVGNIEEVFQRSYWDIIDLRKDKTKNQTTEQRIQETGKIINDAIQEFKKTVTQSKYLSTTKISTEDVINAVRERISETEKAANQIDLQKSPQ